MKFSLNTFNRWRKSLQTKATLAVLLTSAILVEVTSVVQYMYARAGIRKEVQHRAEAELRIKNLEIAKVMTAVETAAHSTVWVLEKSLGNPDEVNAVMLGMMKSNPDIEGCGMGFIADYYSSKGYWYEPYIDRLPDGSVTTLQIGSEKHDYFKAAWYAKPAETGECYWSEPYFDEAGGKKLMITYSSPVRNDKGQVVAVFGVDVSLDWLGKVLNANNIYPSSYNLIISRTGQLMACPVESLVMRRNLQEITSGMKDTTVRGVNRKMLDGQSGQATVIDDDGEKNYVFFAPIKSEDSKSNIRRLGWSMAVVCSDSEIYGGLRHMAFNLLLLMFLGMGLLAYIMFRSIRSAHQLRRVNSAKERIDNELAVAQRIQQAMLPKTFSVRDDLDVAAMLMPAREVGGDMYDYCLRDEKLFFCIGDVSGKGVPAAMIMAMAQSAFRMLAERESSPERIVSQMNNALAKDNDYSLFITLLVGVLDLPTGRLRYCNAGHKPPVLLSEKDGEIVAAEEKSEGQLPIGAMADWKYSMQEVDISLGTTIFLYTDGLTEAENHEHEQFGRLRMKNTMTIIEPAKLVAGFDEAVRQFADGTEQSDDLTMLAIRYMHGHNEALFRQELTLLNDVKNVSRLSEFVEQACEKIGLGASETMQVNLAMEEAVVNVMNYAYPDGQKGNVNVVAEANENRLKFIITDNGMPFDPTTKAEVDTTLGVEERSIGGLGIHLIRHYMDSMNYERIDNKNILTLRKRLTK